MSVTLTEIPCPGIKVENLGNTNTFLLIIKMKPSPISVLNDEPIPLTDKDQFLPKLSNAKFNGERIDYNPIYQDAESILQENKDYFDSVIDKIKKMEGDISDSLNPETSNKEQDCPVDNLDIDTLLNNLKNGDESNLVTTEYIDPSDISTYDSSKSAVSYCNETDQLNLVDQIKIPDISLTAYGATSPDNLSCLFNDDKLKNVGSYIENSIIEPENNLVKQVQDQITPNSLTDSGASAIKDNLKKSGLLNEDDEVDLNSVTAPAPQMDIEKAIQDKFHLLFELGIPMAVLDNENEIYLQIIDKKLQVTNLIDFNGVYLELDEEIDLIYPSVIAFFTNGYSHTLYYINEHTGETFSKTISIRKNLTVKYIGIDDKLRKHYCGEIFDIQILTFQRSNLGTYTENQYQFKPPVGVLYYYDWYKTRINRNLVYPLPDLQPPVKMYSQGGYTDYILHTENKNYYFMEVGYLSQFFCWRRIENKDFSISFWFNKLNYENGSNSDDYKTLIHDEINNYSLKYNDYLKKFKIVLNTYEETLDYLIEDNLWYFCNFKYSDSERKLYLNIRNIDQIEYNDVTELVIDLNPSSYDDILKENFRLSSMLAKKELSNFSEYFNCLFGTLALFDNKRETAEEYQHFRNERIVFKNLNN